MPKHREKYTVAGVDLSSVRNRNEVRVAECMRKAIEKLGGEQIPEALIQDAYAFALNQLPARYTQRGTIVLRDPVRKAAIEYIVAGALDHVLGNPKR